MISVTALLLCSTVAWADSGFIGDVRDPQGNLVEDATVRLTDRSTAQPIKPKSVQTDKAGRFQFDAIPPGSYSLTAEFAQLKPVTLDAPAQDGVIAQLNLMFTDLAGVHDSIVITASTVEPETDLRNQEVFNRTLFTRDDQIFQQLNAGINVGQHEGGGKSLEIRRFGFNLDHGGVNGGLKVMVDGVQQNQGTQGHGQGYLGSLKTLSPELIEDVSIINGPFSAEYGDFSGLGVVHIRQRETMPQRVTLRGQGGNFGSGRGFVAFSPDVEKTDAYIAYEGSYTDGPFQNPGRYRRDNVNTNYTKQISDREKLGFRFIYGRNNFYSSGQIPLDLVSAGQLDRFGYLDPNLGGHVNLGTASMYYSKELKDGGSLKADGFVGRSLFDLYSNFTYFLNDPIHGDGIQQHDSRLQEGANVQWLHPHKIGHISAVLVSGSNFHDNQINVGLYPREDRTPIGVTTRAHAHVTNAAGYMQETLTLLKGRLILGGGLRFDEFRYGLLDRIDPTQSGAQAAGRWQGKGTLAYTPFHAIPVTFHANYGRGISSVDARAAVYRPDQPRLATTDFYQTGVSSSMGRLAVSADAFLIDRSNEQVYIPDDGTFEFAGPSRSYGFETKASLAITHHISINGGLTKVSNAYYKGNPDELREYITNAPHFTGNAALTVSSWAGWSGSLRMRSINSYRLDGFDPSIRATGYTLFDMSIAKQIHRGMEINLSLDNATNRAYYETQNYGESRVSPTAPVVSRIHATPGYPLTVAVGMTLRLGGK
ncbi:MAG: TonB-dependent receptor [Acidobacteriota bacterium]